MKYTERERELLDNWPTVTEQDLERINDLFPSLPVFPAGEHSGSADH